MNIKTFTIAASVLCASFASFNASALTSQDLKVAVGLGGASACVEVLGIDYPEVATQIENSADVIIQMYAQVLTRSEKQMFTQMMMLGGSQMITLAEHEPETATKTCLDLSSNL